VKRGAWKPGQMDVEIEHVFVALDDKDWGNESIRGVIRKGRTPLVTVEPWRGFPDADKLAQWRLILMSTQTIYVRYMHEMNGTWYPWGGQPEVFQREWARWHDAMPRNVRLVWCPNVSYPGSSPIADYWPDPDLVDWIGLDGYARDGESMEQVFGPTLEELWRERITRYGKPLMVAETGTPRGRAQAKWWRDGMRWAERQGIAAVVAFAEDKAHLGGDERDWSLSKAAQKAFLEG